MTADERYQYDTQNSRRIEREESNQRIQKYIDSGMSREDALNKEIQTANYMYPEAKAYQERERDVEKKRKELESARRNEAEFYGFKKAYEEAVKLLEVSKYEYTMRQVIYDNVEAQRKSLEQANKEQEKAKAEAEAAAKAAKEKAAAEEAARLAKEKASRPNGSIADIEYQISQKNKEISVAISDSDRIRLSTELDELVQKKRYMDLAIKYSQPAFDTKQIADMANAKSTFSNMAKLPDGWNKINTTKWDNQGIKDQINAMNDYQNAISSVESALSNLSGTFDSDSQNAFSYFANIIQGAAQAATAIMALIPVKKAEANANAEAAVTGAASSVASIPFVGAAMAVAAVAALIASMAAIPKFAKGGIIGGSSFYGDRLLARVNSGEMILNKEQQKSLYQMTSGENDINITSFKVRGDELFLVLKNYMKKTGKKL